MNAKVVLGVMLLVVAGCSWTPKLDTRTFELQYLDPDMAVGLIDPYVYGGRPGAEGVISVAGNLVTVRETTDNLEKIARVLTQYDRPVPSVRLHFQLIEADGAKTSDPAIAEMESVLRKLFRFNGYALLAQAVLGGMEGSSMEQGVAVGDRQYKIHSRIVDVLGVGDSRLVRIAVSLTYSTGAPMFTTTVNARAGQTVVLGSTQPYPSQKTLILTVRPELVMP